jgi:hypothetical protein
MEIKEMKVSWNIGWANLPSLNMLLDEPPPKSEVWRKFEMENGGTYFVSRLKPLVRFVFEAKTGGGALSREVTLEDGTTYRTNGGWSSSDAQINRLRATDPRFSDYLPHDVIDITYYGEYARPGTYNDGWGLGMAGLCFEIPWVVEQMAEHLPGVTLVDLTDRTTDGRDEHQASSEQSLIIGGTKNRPYIPVPAGGNEIRPDIDSELFQRTAFTRDLETARRERERKAKANA